MADPGVPIHPQQVLAEAASPPLNGVPAPAAPAAPASAKTPHPTEHKDGAREIVETVVFVVVLVLLLKSFVAEAFVIPTGSMAETLWGYQKVVDCPKCRYHFPVNCSKEVDPQGGPKIDTVRATCPNCRYDIDFKREGMDPPPSSGDRVLVAKFLYDLFRRLPERHDVVVFKYPQEPQKGTIPTNYIKRLVGLPGETIAIHYGNLYYLNGFAYPERPQPEKEEDRWRPSYTYEDDVQALSFFTQGKYQIIRKPPAVMLAQRRIVYDNDFQNPDLPQRWDPHAGEGAWTPDAPGLPKSFTSPTAAAAAWLRYRHIHQQDHKPELITDFMGYNTADGEQSQNWVGDLMLECEATPAEAAGTLLLELSRGVDRFRARFDLAAGTCTLERYSNGATEKLGDTKPLTLKPGTKHALRFANFDDRLTLWVNNTRPFDDGVIYPAPEQRGPTPNDLEPASIGTEGAKVTVTHLRVWRDTYYTQGTGNLAGGQVNWSDPSSWGGLSNLPAKTYYVQPDHFLCMGDNSPASSDGRSWGLVPRRLMLGRALAVYYPFYFPYAPLNSQANRVGAIH